MRSQRPGSGRSLRLPTAAARDVSEESAGAAARRPTTQRRSSSAAGDSTWCAAIAAQIVISHVSDLQERVANQ